MIYTQINFKIYYPRTYIQFQTEYMCEDKLFKNENVNNVNNAEQQFNRSKITSYAAPIKMKPIQRPKPAAAKPPKIQISTKIKGKYVGMKEWARRRAKYLISIIYDKDYDKFCVECNMCKRWMNELQKANPHLGNVYIICRLNKEQLFDTQYFKCKGVLQLRRHFNTNTTHTQAHHFENDYKWLVNNTLTLLSDIAYGQIIYTATKKVKFA